LISDPFLQPSTPLPQGDVGEGWIKDHPNIDEVARFCQPVLSVSKALEEYWDPDHVHFLITVKAPVEDAGPITVEEGAHVPELPLHIMHHRKSWVLTPPFHIVNLLRFP